MKNILIRGPLLTQSGYGYHARQFVHWSRELQKNKIVKDVFFDLTPWGINPWMLKSEDVYDQELIEYIMSNSTKPETNKKFDVSVQIQLPHEWNPELANLNIGVTAGVETDLVSRDWVQSCFRMDRVVVPSQFSKKSFIDSVKDEYDKRRLDKKISVVNEAFHPTFLEFVDENKNDLDFSHLPEKCFLFFGQITGTDASNDRKNTFNLIKWFVEEYGDDKNVGLIIKTNSGRNTTIDKKLTKTKLDSCVNEVLSILNKKSKPNIFLLHGSMSEEEKVQLYKNKKIVALLMPTRGEGYGLPVLEAAVVGLPIIAPMYSGYMDFASNVIDYPLEFRFELVPKSRIDNIIFVKGCKWLDIDPLSIKKNMDLCLKQSDNRNLKNKELLKLKNNFKIENICEKLNTLFLRDIKNSGFIK
jgi:glycosyltransferase involved in cell wall biosynthesis